MLRELDHLYCADESIDSISGFQNLQILRLVGSVDEFDNYSFTDIGLTKVGHKLKRLVKLELSECECSYEGIAAIGHCCSILEELILSNIDIFEGWIAALSFFKSLKCLRFEGCKKLDFSPGSEDHLGICAALEKLHLRRNLQDRGSFGALALVSSPITELELKDCWALDDEILMQAANCRKVRYLSLEGCSSVSTCALESLLASLKDLQRLKILSCNNIRNSEITLSLSSLFTTLEELQWCPDTKSFLAVSLEGTGMVQKRGQSLKRA